MSSIDAVGELARMRGSARRDRPRSTYYYLEPGKEPAMYRTDSEQLHAIARSVRGVGWLLAFVILVLGAVMAARANAEIALLMRVTLAGAVLALTSAAGWLIGRYAKRAAARQPAPR